jgi:ketosteroid isomerase-like protein
VIPADDIPSQTSDYGATPAVKKNSLICLILASLIGLSSMCARAQDAAVSIPKVMQAQTDAWNRGDVDGFMAAYKQSDETTYIGKHIAHGYGHILANYKERYTTPEVMGRLTFSDLKVRPLGENFAVVTGKFALARSAAGGGPADGVFSLVWEKTSDGWKIILDHTS